MNLHEQKEFKDEIFRAVSGVVERKLERDLVVLKEEIGKAIAINVNGKIDKIHTILEEQNKMSDFFMKKVDAHIAEVEPFIQAKAGLGILFNWLLIIAAGVVAWGQIKMGLK